MIQRLEHRARLLAGLTRPAQDHLVAIGVSLHAKLALDMREILVVMAEHQRGETVIVEGQRNFLRGGLLPFDGGEAGDVRLRILQ